MAHRSVSNIVIVGGGTAGWMTAAALSKILGAKRHRINLIESDQIGTVGVGEATIPQILMYNSVLGLDEDEFIAATNATFKLGIEFRNWRKPGEGYFHPFGKLGVDMDGISFMHYWQRWAREGGKLHYTDFNAETEAARAGRFMRTDGEQSGAMPQINYAFQFDASLYAAYLRRFSEMRGVIRHEGKVESVERDGETGLIERLHLDRDRVIEGDLFVDCTGFRGLLIEQTYGAGYQDWTRWLPANRAVAVPCAQNEPPVPYTRATAQEAGWQWRIPLQHRIGNGYVFSDEFISEDEATAKLLSRLDGEPLAEPKVLRFVTGRRNKFWIGNCVAIGLSAGFLEPLESTSIHLIQKGIAKLLAMLPQHTGNMSAMHRFNHEIGFDYDDVKDFLIAHYCVTERDDTPFWNHVRTMEIPEQLAERLQLFRERGEMLVTHNELFKETSWFAVLMGQGLKPEGYHPVADVPSTEDLRARLSRIRNGVTQRVAQMPQHLDFIRGNCPSEALQAR